MKSINSRILEIQKVAKSLTCTAVEILNYYDCHKKREERRPSLLDPSLALGY
jgi:hypothetical protein